MIELKFDRGTISTVALSAEERSVLPQFVLDPRTQTFRAPANSYRDIIINLREHRLTYDDGARSYSKIAGTLRQELIPRKHQDEALTAWVANERLGVVSLPTGAGKTILAVMAIAQAQRSTLVVVPTIDLLHQWQSVLTTYFDEKIGLLGGGYKDLGVITVATYDTALLTMPHYGAKFGLLVFDECHHLPAPQYQEIARASLAPFRLGLSATVERADGNEQIIYDLVGPLVYNARIEEMVSKVLSPYDVVTIQVPLSESEQREYTESRAIYTSFLRRAGVDFSSPRGWMDFVARASRSPDGKNAMRAYRRQKQLANAAEGKFQEVWQLMQIHRNERMIIFTSENSLAYELGKKFLLPVLTHHTKPTERRAILDAFRSGELNILATSKVLNEGVDVPDASVGIVLSGSGAVREHVQRLGRVLRYRPGKRAVLYEITSQGTSEKYVSDRRRQHDAYRQ